MNNRNKILVGCLALLLALSVGYALFSDTITINGTATAKGEFELTTEAVDLSESWFEEYLGLTQSNGLVENPTISIENNIVNASVTLGMPGSWHYFGIKITNTGTIPAKLKSMEDITNSEVIFDSTNAGVTPFHCIGESRINRICMEFYNDSGWSDDYESDMLAGERWFEPYFDSEVLNAILDPGEEAYFFLYYHWNTNSTTQGEPLELSWSVKLNWEQITE